MPDYTEAKAARKKMHEAISEYVLACAEADGEACVMTGSVVMWEQARFRDDGEAEYSVNYCFPAPISLSSGAGIITIGAEVAISDMASEDGDD